MQGLLLEDRGLLLLWRLGEYRGHLGLRLSRSHVLWRSRWLSLRLDQVSRLLSRLEHLVAVSLHELLWCGLLVDARSLSGSHRRGLR